MSSLMAEVPVRASALARMAKRLARGSASTAQADQAAARPSLRAAAGSPINATNTSRALAIHSASRGGGMAALPALQGSDADQECRPNVIVVLTSHKTGTAQARCDSRGGASRGRAAFSRFICRASPDIVAQ